MKVLGLKLMINWKTIVLSSVEKQYYNYNPYLSMGHTNRPARISEVSQAQNTSSRDNKCIQDDHSMTYIDSHFKDWEGYRGLHKDGS